jgi:FMN-dependent NADH-azoreductase
MKLLHIDASALGSNSISRQLGRAVVARFREAHPDLVVLHEDLDANPVPHLTGAVLGGQDAAAAARGEQLLADFLAADAIVIGVPMYNFTIPSTLKAWIDRIAVAGKTFRYTADGPRGLAGGKRVVLAIAQGGVHPLGSASEFQESYLRFVLGFLGITDIEVLRAEGVNLSPERREQALNEALASLPEPAALKRAA